MTLTSLHLTNALAELKYLQKGLDIDSNQINNYQKRDIDKEIEIEYQEVSQTNLDNIKITKEDFELV